MAKKEKEAELMEQLIKLLIMILKKIFGIKDEEEDEEKEKKMDETLQILMEMIKELRERQEDLFSKENLKNKNPETMNALKNTVTAAIAAQELTAGKKADLHNLLEKRNTDMKALNKMEPGSPEHDKLTKDLKKTEADIKKELKTLNSMDTNKERKEAFDKKLDSEDFMKDYDKAQDDISKITPTMKNGEPLSDAQDKSLTSSLENLYGMDPRIEGAGVSPVQQVVGNEMEIPDGNPAYTAYEPLHALSGRVDNIPHDSQKEGQGQMSEMEKAMEARYNPEEKKPGQKQEMDDKVDKAIDDTLDSKEGQEATRAPSPSPSPDK